MNYRLKTENLCFSYGERQILNNISFRAEEGSFISVIGPNGSGKSTLLKLIASVLKPDNGEILINGIDISALKRKEIARVISVVPQNTALEFDFKVKDVVLMGRYSFINKLSGETREDIAIARDSMIYTNTLQLAERNFMELSGGERQRVILAQALTQKPQILILDEPISHLDLQYQVELLNLIRKMCIDKKLTVIAVLHDLNMASTYSDKVIMLKDGEIKHQGTPMEVLTASNIKNTYNTDVYVSIGEIGHKPYVYTLTRPHIESKNIRVHIICGGGSGSGLIKELYYKGYDLSSGVLTIGDSDWKVSKENELAVAEDIPFTTISDDSYNINKKLLSEADFIILTGFYIGKANIRNLEILLENEVKAKKLLILDDDTFEGRNFYGSYAQEIYDEIKHNTNTSLTTRAELYMELDRRETV